MKAEIVTEWGRFDALEAEWNALLSRSRADVLFLRWEWIRSWRKVLGEAVRPFAVVVRDGEGALAGVAPFYRTGYRLLRAVLYRALRIMGDYPTGAECLDWILRSDVETEAARAVAAALSGASGEWDFLWMPYVPRWTGGRDRIRNACAEAGFRVSEREVPFGVLTLPPTIEGLVSSFGASHRYNVRRDLKRTFGAPSTRFVRCREEGEIPRFLEALFRLHALRWGLEGQAGTFHRKPNEARFYREFAPEAHRRGWLGLYGVEVSGELKAVQYGYLYNGSFLQMQEGLDQGSGRGMGNLLRLKVMDDLIGGGIRSYDFLGELSEHKQRWHIRERLGSHLMAGNGKMKSGFLFANGIWPTGRYLVHADAEALRGAEGEN